MLPDSNIKLTYNVYEKISIKAINASIYEDFVRTLLKLISYIVDGGYLEERVSGFAPSLVVSVPLGVKFTAPLAV